MSSLFYRDQNYYLELIKIPEMFFKFLYSLVYNFKAWEP
jgi:hypothetical protein